MKYIYKRAVALLLTLSCLLALAGCSPEDEVVQSGIKLEDDAPYTETTESAAEEAILELLEYGCLVSVADSISSQMQATLEDYAGRIQAITAKNLISEVQYLSLIDMLSSQGKGVIDELAALYGGTGAEYSKVRELYLSLSSLLGADYVGALIYDLCLLRYDISYERTMERYEKYGYQYLLEDAAAIEDEREIFSAGIGADAFTAVIKNAFAISEILLGGNSLTSENFSDAELLTVIRHLDLSDMDLDTDSWALLLSYLSPSTVSSEGPYPSRLIKAAEQNGDLDRAADVMTPLVKLTEAIRDKLTAEDVKALREGDTEALASSVFSRFGDGEWQLFATVTEIELSNDAYAELAREQYGDGWSDTLAGLKKVGLQDLRASVGNGDFYENLTGYLALICPALSYEVIK